MQTLLTCGDDRVVARGAEHSVLSLWAFLSLSDRPPSSTLEGKK